MDSSLRPIPNVGYVGGSTERSSEPMSVIDHELRELHAAVAECESAVSNFLQKCQPVIAEVPESAAKEAGERGLTRASCRVGNEIHEARAKIQDMTRVVRRLTDCVEL